MVREESHLDARRPHGYIRAADVPEPRLQLRQQNGDREASGGRCGTEGRGQEVMADVGDAMKVHERPGSDQTPGEPESQPADDIRRYHAQHLFGDVTSGHVVCEGHHSDWDRPLVEAVPKDILQGRHYMTTTQHADGSQDAVELLVFCAPCRLLRERQLKYCRHSPERAGHLTWRRWPKCGGVGGDRSGDEMTPEHCAGHQIRTLRGRFVRQEADTLSCLGCASTITTPGCHGNPLTELNTSRSSHSCLGAGFSDHVMYGCTSMEQPFDPFSISPDVAGLDTTARQDSRGYVSRRVQTGCELPLHRLADGRLSVYNLITALYEEYFNDVRVPRQMYDTLDGARDVNDDREFTLRRCSHHRGHQVASSCRESRDFAEGVRCELGSCVTCANLPIKSGFRSDSAYCSLERHLVSGEYVALAEYSDHVVDADGGRCSSDDGELDEDSGTEECSSDDTNVTFIMDAVAYTREKLSHRTKDMLTVLKDQFSRLIQEVSEELVRLLEERHELKEQVEMRKIAVEQLVRLQATTGRSVSHYDVIVRGDD